MSQRVIKIADAVKILTYIVGLMAFLSVVREISLSYSLAFGALYLLSLCFEYNKNFLIPRWLLTILALLMIVFTFFRMYTDDPVLAAVEALLILLAIKSLEEKRFRDYMQIYLIALFLLTASALLSVDIEFLLYFICLIFLVAAATVLLTYFSQDSTLELTVSTLMKIVSKSSLIPLIAVPSTIFMFVILPRTSYPLLHFLNRGTHASTGFSDHVSLGKVSDIQEDATVILRSHMERVDENLLYWRGIVLDFFDGASWKSLQKEKVGKGRPSRISGKQILQTIYLEPYGNRYLFALDKPSSIALRSADRYIDLTYSLPNAISRRTRYESVSALSDVLFEEEIDRGVYLQMPDKNLEKTRELVNTLSSGKTKEATINVIINFLRSGDYRYSLQNLPISDNPLEDFLFTHKYGNCEYFASAMAVMLRMAGIPSRVVGGYRGGYYNDTGEYYLVPQKNAHVWVEAYLENKGWVREDPTPAGIENFVSLTKRDVLFKVRLFFDAMNYYWNALIINYDFSKQMSLFYKLKSFKKPKFHISIKTATVTTYSSVLLFIGLSIMMIYILTSRRKDPEEKVLNEFFRKVGKYGYRKSKGEGLEEFVSKIDDEAIKAKAYNFVKEFERYYYRDIKLTKENIRNLRQIMS